MKNILIAILSLLCVSAFAQKTSYITERVEFKLATDPQVAAARGIIFVDTDTTAKLLAPDGTVYVLGGPIGSGLWSILNDSTIYWKYGGDTAFFYISNGNVKLGSDADLSFQVKGNNAYKFVGTASTAAEIRLNEDTDNGTNYTGWKAPASLAGNVPYTLPSADGTNGQVLTTNASGTLTWATVGDSSLWLFSSDTLRSKDVSFKVGGVAANDNVLIYTDSASLGVNDIFSVYHPTASTAGILRLQEGTTNGNHSVAHSAPASLAASYTITWPADDGTSGQYPTTNGSGVLAWNSFAYGEMEFDDTTYTLSLDSAVAEFVTNGAGDLWSAGTVSNVTYTADSLIATLAAVYQVNVQLTVIGSTNTDLTLSVYKDGVLDGAGVATSSMVTGNYVTLSYSYISSASANDGFRVYVTNIVNDDDVDVKSGSFSIVKIN